MSRACLRSGRFLIVAGPGCGRASQGRDLSRSRRGGLPRGPFKLQGAGVNGGRSDLVVARAPYGHHLKNDLELALTRGIRLSN